MGTQYVILEKELYSGCKLPEIGVALTHTFLIKEEAEEVCDLLNATLGHESLLFIVMEV